MFAVSGSFFQRPSSAKVFPVLKIDNKFRKRDNKTLSFSSKLLYDAYSFNSLLLTSRKNSLTLICILSYLLQDESDKKIAFQMTLDQWRSETKNSDGEKVQNLPTRGGGKWHKFESRNTTMRRTTANTYQLPKGMPRHFHCFLQLQL